MDAESSPSADARCSTPLLQYLATLEHVITTERCPHVPLTDLLSHERYCGVLEVIPKLFSTEELFDSEDRNHLGDLLKLLLEPLIARLRATDTPTPTY